MEICMKQKISTTVTNGRRMRNKMRLMSEEKRNREDDSREINSNVASQSANSDKKELK